SGFVTAHGTGKGTNLPAPRAAAFLLPSPRRGEGSKNAAAQIDRPLTSHCNACRITVRITRLTGPPFSGRRPVGPHRFPPLPAFPRLPPPPADFIPASPRGLRTKTPDARLSGDDWYCSCLSLAP